MTFNYNNNSFNEQELVPMVYNEPKKTKKSLSKKQKFAVLAAGIVMMSFILSVAGGAAVYSVMSASDRNNNGVIYSAVTRTSGNSGTQQSTVAAAAASCADSVVEITTESVTTSGMMRQYVSEGAGSGVIISTDGYIVTNNHVIDGANKITVRTTSGDSYAATLVGKDAKTDLAVIKIEATDLTPAVFGDSDSLSVGETAVAIGNPLGELGGTVTEGIVSALNREIVMDGETMTLLQTSAAINPGNSGGGLFDADGNLIGVVNAKSSGTGIEGLGFAIPANTVKTVAMQIINFGYVKGRVDTGLTLIDINDYQTASMYRVREYGVYVLKTDRDDSEIRSGDRIIAVNLVSVNDSSEFNAEIEKYSVGETIVITVSRNDTRYDIELTLSELTN